MKALTTPFLFSFVGLMFFSLFAMGYSFETKHAASGCVFASHYESVCPLGALDLIGAWKSVFMSALAVVSIIILVGSMAVLVGTAPHLLGRPLLHTIPISPRFHQLKHRIHAYIYRALQEFFARGILHPKLF